jgi:hypothetical protein
VGFEIYSESEIYYGLWSQYFNTIYMPCIRIFKIYFEF